MSADRLMSALLLLRMHGRLTERELAAGLAVSEHTVRRDLEALSAAGVPVFAGLGAQMSGNWTRIGVLTCPSSMRRSYGKCS